LAGGGFPDAGRLIAGSGEELLAVGAEANRVDAVVVAAQVVEILAGGRVPDGGDAVGEDAAVRLLAVIVDRDLSALDRESDAPPVGADGGVADGQVVPSPDGQRLAANRITDEEIGRASCRERVENGGGAVRCK